MTSIHNSTSLAKDNSLRRLYLERERESNDRLCKLIVSFAREQEPEARFEKWDLQIRFSVRLVLVSVFLRKAGFETGESEDLPRSLAGRVEDWKTGENFCEQFSLR